MLCQILLTMVFIISLTNRGLLLIWRGWLKGQQKNNLWANLPKVCRQDISICDKSMWHVQHSDCHSHTAQLSNYCSYLTFMTWLRWNFWEIWEILRSCAPYIFVRSFSPSGSIVTSLVGVRECGKAKSTCAQIVTRKRSKQQQKSVHTGLLAPTS